MVLPLLAAGQERPRLFPPDSSSCTRIIAKGGYEMDANAIYNELLLGLVNGGYLERELRQRSSDALTGMNRLGQVFQVRATVIAGDSIFHQPGLQWSVSASHQDQGGMRFRPDVFDLTFFGNAAYEDRTADLSNSAYERQIFQTLGMGLYWGRTGDHVRLDLVKGQSLNAVELEDATLYTAPDGRRLDVRLHGDYLQSDTAVNGSDMRTWNGSGCALSFSYGYALGPENGSPCTEQDHRKRGGSGPCPLEQKEPAHGTGHQLQLRRPSGRQHPRSGRCPGRGRDPPGYARTEL
ncbi:MAG: hypothetical protein IPL77_11980 [Flavobacteriales bacterium]|nr:hypothetical protein [Flavobacteriales bacterium]